MEERAASSGDFDHEPLLDEIAGRELVEWRTKVPPPNEAAFESSARKVREACSIFHKRSGVRQAGDATLLRSRVGFEGEKGPLSSPDPVDGHSRPDTSRSRRIDRVDAVGEERYEVWDYKTDSPYSYRKSGRLHARSIVQHARSTPRCSRSCCGVRQAREGGHIGLLLHLAERGGSVRSTPRATSCRTLRISCSTWSRPERSRAARRTAVRSVNIRRSAEARSQRRG